MNDVPGQLGWGDTVPRFRAPVLEGNDQYAFDTVAGRHVLLLLFGTGTVEACAAGLAAVQTRRELFDDEKACFFGVTVDPQDAASGRIRQQLPGMRYFLDYDRRVSGMFGAVSGDQYHPHWLLLDPTLRVFGRFPVEQPEEALAALAERLSREPPADAWAPVVAVPNIFEPALCQRLIALYEANGGDDSGFMRDVDGKTVSIIDHHHKQRRDFVIEQEDLRRALAARMKRRLNPVLKQVFHFEATRMERYLVACYDAGAGHFRPHRDNTTRGTAHRQFAVTINLNAGDYEGGDLRFPEFGPRIYRAPTGGAIVFSCSLLHEATPVTAGKRYAFLPFLYDEQAAELREANNPFLGPGVGEYRKSGLAESSGAA